MLRVERVHFDVFEDRERRSVGSDQREIGARFEVAVAARAERAFDSIAKKADACANKSSDARGKTTRRAGRLCRPQNRELKRAVDCSDIGSPRAVGPSELDRARKFSAAAFG